MLGFTGIARHQDARQFTLILAQLLQQLWADGQSIAAGQLLDLADIAEAGAHDHGVVAIGLVVVVDTRDRLHARIFRAHVFFASALLVPVVDPAHERRNQEYPGIGTRLGLGEGEQQGQVGLDAFFFQHLGGADAFPGRGQLDQHPVTADTGLVVQRDQLPGLGQQRRLVEGQAGVDLGGDTPRNHLENAGANGYGKGVTGNADIALAVLDRLLEQLGITGHGRSLEQQGRVGGGIDRFQAADGVDITGVGNHSGELLELFQLGSHGRALSCAMDRHYPSAASRSRAGWQAGRRG
ncbi:hypothetical protein D3C80_1093630 [compost metagenome]